MLTEGRTEIDKSNRPGECTKHWQLRSAGDESYLLVVNVDHGGLMFGITVFANNFII